MVLIVASSLLLRVLICFGEGHRVPRYTYRCSNCSHQFELKQGFDAKPEQECPACNQLAQRRFHPVGVIYKGSGFYTTDYRKAPNGSSDADAGDASESKAPKTEGTEAG